MEDFVAPFFGGRPKAENDGSLGCLQAQFAVHNFRGFDRGKRNLQAEIASKENFARFEQGLPFRPLLAQPSRAFHFVSHGG